MSASSACELVKSTKKRGRDVLMMDDDYREDFYPITPLMDASEYFDGWLAHYSMQLRKSCLSLMLGIMGKLGVVGYPFLMYDDNNSMLNG